MKSCKYGNGPSSSVKGRVFLDKLKDYKLLKKVIFVGI
jgi:hypothetical protein